MPSEFTYISSLGSIHTSTPVYNAGTHTITFPFLPSIPAGSTGQLKVILKVKTGLARGTIVALNCGNSALTNSSIIRSSCVNVSIVVPPAMNLFTISKVKRTPSGSTYLGRNVTYDVSVCNPANAATNGGVDLVSAVLRDSLPPNATFVSATNSGTYSAGVVTWNLGTLAASNTASCTTVSVTVNYPSPTFTAGTTVTNTAYLSGTSGGSPVTVGPATASHPLLATQNLWTVAKTKLTPSAQAFLDNNVSYQIAVCNPSNALTNGGGDFIAPVIKDTLPVGATFVSATSGGTYSGGIVTWNLANLSASNSASCTNVTITVNYPSPTFTAGSSVTNNGYVAGTVGTSAVNIGSTVTHTLAALQNLWTVTKTKTIPAGTAYIGDNVTYQIAVCNPANAVTNNGFDLVAAVVKDTLPPNTTFVSANNGGTYSGGIVTWNLGTLTASNTASCTNLTVTLIYPPAFYTSGASVTNTAKLAGTVNNAMVMQQTSVTHPVAVQQNLWTVSKTKVLPSGTVYIGDSVTYQIALCNPSNGTTNGSVDLANIVMIDTLPVGALFISATSSGVYNAVSRTVTWTIPNQTVTNSSFCVTRQVVLSYPSGTFNNGDNVCNGSAVFGDMQGFAVGAKVGASQICHTLTLLVPVCDATVSKSISSNTNIIGQVQTFNIAMSNIGNVILNNFYFEDTIPAAINLTQIQTRKYNGTTFSITVNYQTNLNSTYTNWVGSPVNSNSNTTLNVSALGLGATEYITKVRYQYGNVAVGFASTTNAKVIGTLISPNHNGATVNTNDVISNCANIKWDCNNTSSSRQGCGTFTVDALVASPTSTVSKTKATATLGTGAIQQYSFAVNNIGNVPLSNYTLTDAIPLNINLTSIQTGVYNGAATNITVKYTTNTNATFTTWTGSPFLSSTNYTLNIADIGLPNYLREIILFNSITAILP